MEIKSTKEYSKFKFSESNRSIDFNNLRKLKNSIESRNLMHLRPILVNENFEIMDGQHRFLACKELDVEIYYQIQKDSSIVDMLLLNVNQKVWGGEDYLKYYSSQGNEEYIKIKNYMRKNKISLKVFLYLGGMSRGATYSSLKTGTIKLGDKIETVITPRLNNFHRMCKFVAERHITQCKFLSKSRFIYAFCDFISAFDIDFEVFMSKLEIKLNYLRSCERQREYLEILIAIYNYKNNNPITDSVLKRNGLE